MKLEHGAKAAKVFTQLIRQTVPKPDKPGKNRSIVVGETPAQPVILVSQKRPSAAVNELKSVSKPLGTVKVLAAGKVVLEGDEVKLKTSKPANVATIRSAFVGYYKRYKVLPPTKAFSLLEVKEGEDDFEEDPNDLGADDPSVGEDGGAQDGEGARAAAGQAGPVQAPGPVQDGNADAAELTRQVATIQQQWDRLDAAVGTHSKAKALLEEASALIRAAGVIAAGEGGGDAGATLKAARDLMVRSFNIAKSQPEDPRSAFVAELARLKPLVGAAMGQEAKTPVTKQLADDLRTAVGDMRTADNAGNYADGMKALRKAETAVRRLNLARQVGEEAKQQLVTKQAEQYRDMKAIADEVTRTYFNPGAAFGHARIKKESLSPGKEFRSYLEALEALEKLRSGGDAQAIRGAAATVEQAAQKYLQHYGEDLSAREKKDRKSLRKKQICEEAVKTARQYQIALDIQGLGTPAAETPWSDDKQIRATQLRAQISFETGYKKGSDLKAEGGGGASSAYWVLSNPPGSQKPSQTFIFKPMEGTQSEFNEDGAASVAKEALASAGSKLVQAQTGIDLGVPESSVGTIGNYALDSGGDPKGATIGSLQQFERADGELGAQTAATVRGMPASECQRMGVLDIMNLNVDRHAANFLIRNQPGGPKMVPIDHGNTLPPLADFKKDRTLRENIAGVRDDNPTKMGLVKNVLMTMPGSHEPFSQEMADRLSLLEPEAVVGGMTQHLAGLDRVNPGLNAKEAVDPKSLELSKRVMQFLKRAAPSLSPAAVQIAIARHHDRFGNFDQPVEDFAEEIIADLQAKAPGYKEFFTAPVDRREAILNALLANGWANPAALIMKDPVTALKLYKAGVAKGAEDDPSVAVQHVDAAEVLRHGIGKLLEGARADLQQAEPPETDDLLRRAQALEPGASATEAGLAGLEEQVRALCTEVLDSCLAAIRRSGDALFEAHSATFQDAGQDRTFRHIHSALTYNCGMAASVKAARRDLDDMEKLIRDRKVPA